MLYLLPVLNWASIIMNDVIVRFNSSKALVNH
jgi:hypothetical protein